MSAANDVKLLCEAILHFNKEGLKKFKYSREDLYKMWTNSFIEEMKTILNNLLTEEHAKRIGDILISTLKKVDVSTNEVEKGKVKVTVKGLDVGNIFTDKDGQLDLNLNPKATKEEFLEAVLRAVEDKFNALKPAQTVTFVVDCDYYKKEKFWAPMEMDKFVPQLLASATGGR